MLSKCKEELGSDSKAVQCDLCAAWIHTKCEGLSDEVYDNIMVLGGLSNVAYYCDTNNCISRIKQLLFTFLDQDKLDKPDNSHLVVQQEDLSKYLDDLSLKIADLSAKQQTLHQSIQNMRPGLRKQGMWAQTTPHHSTGHISVLEMYISIL